MTAFKPRSDRPGQYTTICYPCRREYPSNIKYRKSEAYRSTQRRHWRKHANMDIVHKLELYGRLPDTEMVSWLKKTRTSKAKKTVTRGRSPCGTLTAKWVKKWSGVTHCAITGLPFVLTGEKVNGSPHPLSPSADRINPRRGYTDRNTRVISYFANVAKNAWPEEQFRLLVLTAASHMRH